MTVIYHNPRCSKSRATLALLRERGVEPQVVRYLDTPPDAAALRAITVKLNCSIRDLIRSGEDVYRALGLGGKIKTLSESALIDIVAAHPKLLQRPIVIHGKRAAIGRPPENVLSILQP
ncbi:MAG: arsenate reductase (glutaredoxin) [Gammaproteobacteria bacterium]|nr:arsenate reductase (glutaredoxin) [Gammaproteobacteria bacterium]